jgi:hypothetical protein
MSKGRAFGPGRRSVEGLAWLARVGASPADTWATAMGWASSTTASHAQRLERTGLLGRSPRHKGQGGALLHATPLGVQFAGVEAAPLRRPPRAVTWPHLEACAQMAAYLTIRRREMIAPRELLVDERWVGELEWTEHGESRGRRHRPDFVATAEGGRSMAIEIELQAKTPERLRAILGMYLEWLSDGRVDTVLYVAGGERERRQLLREAPKVGLELAGSRFGVRRLEEIQTVGVLGDEMASW